jgi:hypothetical protein
MTHLAALPRLTTKARTVRLDFSIVQSAEPLHMRQPQNLLVSIVSPYIYSYTTTATATDTITTTATLLFTMTMPCF